ncbi:MAG: transcriptional repressor LexA [Candidatus Eisenbacteria bacterium]|uniref:LexA repressor n=1 Tax=Eiseniibacteriota bacterium TaxID=2212470 RepID=A0A849SIP0_UNCEI|nr:transcriptional repressor LexA [Candidatus Eisenbacteria bacterium]
MLSERAREILDYIRTFARERGYPPTIREIGEAFEIMSTNGVRHHLTSLEREGFIRRNAKISRGIDLLLHDDGPLPQLGGIPILGRVAAGEPILAETSFDESLKPGELFGDTQGLFALKVRGDSMIDAGILEGDFVIVRSQDRASSGDMIVALIGDEATVKYYRPRGTHLELEPANEKYKPILVGSDQEFRVLGIVKGVMRTVGR